MRYLTFLSVIVSFVSFLFLSCLAKNQNKTRMKVKKCFDDICLDLGYSKNVPPSSENNSPIVIELAFEVYSIILVDNDHNVIGLTLSLRQSWIDNRIRPRNKKLLKSNSWLPAPAEMGRNRETGLPQQVWMPKFYVYRLTEMDMKSNFQEQSLLWLSKDKKNRYFNYDAIFDLYLKCPMEYQRYPFDEHICSVRFSSADLNATRLIFNMRNAVKWSRHKINIGYFDVEIIPLNKTELLDSWEGENWSIAGFKLGLKRSYWRYIWNYYLSSGLFVLVSWVSFLVPSNDINARIALLITTLLVLVTVFNGVIEMAPKAREGSTALGFWMFSMLVFVVLAFLCHCIAMLRRKSKDISKSKNQKQNKQDMMISGGSRAKVNIENASDTTLAVQKVSDMIRTSENKPDSHSLDFIILAILSILFIVYIVVYSFLYT